MQFFDHVKVHLKAGDGGNGAIAFHREKYVSHGGPSGGDGGNGGNIVFRVDKGTNTLLAYRYKHHFTAQKLAAHDTGNGHRLVAVADHEGVFVDAALYAVQGLEYEGRFKLLDADLFHLTGVEGMHGLTHFQHQIVGHIRQEVDGPHAAVEQADPHIHGADRNGNIVKLDAMVDLQEDIVKLRKEIFEMICQSVEQCGGRVYKDPNGE